MEAKASILKWCARYELSPQGATVIQCDRALGEKGWRWVSGKNAGERVN